MKKSKKKISKNDFPNAPNFLPETTIDVKDLSKSSTDVLLYQTQ